MQSSRKMVKAETVATTAEQVGVPSHGGPGTAPVRALRPAGRKIAAPVRAAPRPTPAQRCWLARGLDQAGGKLPLFDRSGRRIDPRTIRSCIEQGWAAPWFSNPLKPDWLVCRLTGAGRALLERR